MSPAHRWRTNSGAAVSSGTALDADQPELHRLARLHRVQDPVGDDP